MAASVGVFVGCSLYGFLLYTLGPTKTLFAALILAAFCLVAVRNRIPLTMCSKCIYLRLVQDGLP